MSRAIGTVSDVNASTDATAKTFGVDKTTGKVSLPKGMPVGTYALKVRVEAAGNKSCISAAKT